VESGEEVLYRGAKFDVCWPQNLCYKLYSYLLLKQNIPLKVPFSTVVELRLLLSVTLCVSFFSSSPTPDQPPLVHKGTKRCHHFRAHERLLLQEHECKMFLQYDEFVPIYYSSYFPM
jgi:hypothetical protein